MIMFEIHTDKEIGAIESLEKTTGIKIVAALFPMPKGVLGFAVVLTPSGEVDLKKSFLVKEN